MCCKICLTTCLSETRKASLALVLPALYHIKPGGFRSKGTLRAFLALNRCDTTSGSAGCQLGKDGINRLISANTGLLHCDKVRQCPLGAAPVVGGHAGGGFVQRDDAGSSF